MSTDKEREALRQRNKTRDMETKQRKLKRKQWKAWTHPEDKPLAVSFVNFLNDRRDAGLPDLGDQDLMHGFLKYRNN